MSKRRSLTTFECLDNTFDDFFISKESSLPSKSDLIDKNLEEHYLNLSKDKNGKFIVQTLGKIDYYKLTKIVNVVREDIIKDIFMQWAKLKCFSIKHGMDLTRIVSRGIKQKCNIDKFKEAILESPYQVDIEDNSIKHLIDIYNHYENYIEEESFYEIYDYNKTVTGVITGKAEFLFGLFTQLSNSEKRGDLLLNNDVVEIKAVDSRLFGQSKYKREMKDITNDLNKSLGNINLPTDKQIGSSKVYSNKYIMNTISQYIDSFDDIIIKRLIIRKVVNCYRSFTNVPYFKVSDEFIDEIIEWCKEPIVNESKFRYMIASVQTMCYFTVEPFKYIVFVNPTNYICNNIQRDFATVESMFVFLNKYIKVYGSAEDLRLSYQFELKKFNKDIKNDINHNIENSVS